MACCAHITMLRNTCLLPSCVVAGLHLPKKWFLLPLKITPGGRNITVCTGLLDHNSGNVQDSIKSMESDVSGQERHNQRESHSEEDKQRYEQNFKEKILAASLQFVPKHGWTRHALSAGAESIGYAGVAHGMFPKEGAELVQYFSTLCNTQLAEKLQKESNQDGYKQKETQLFIRDAVEARLRMIIPYLEKWPQALAIQSLPPNIPESLANLLTLVDDIWYYAGDRSADFNWYSQRVGLAGLYKVTELCLIQDKSEDFSNTWQFLTRRMDDVAFVHSYLKQSSDVSQMAKETATAAFITARNILGLNFGNR